MFSTILLAIDPSEHARRAAGVAGELAQKLGADLIVAHALEREHDWAAGANAMGGPVVLQELAAVREQATREARKLVDEAVGDLASQGVKVKGEVLDGSGTVTKQLLDAAARADADLIVIGSRGLSDLAGLLIGSVSHKVIQMAHCPVLVVR